MAYNRPKIIYFEFDAPAKLRERMDLVIHRLRLVRTQEDLDKVLGLSWALWQELKQHPDYTAVRWVIEDYSKAIQAAMHRIANPPAPLQKGAKKTT